MKYGLIGEKLGHSLSPELHALFGYPDYVLREIPSGELADFLMRREFCGINVTIPYKQDVIPYLDAISRRARSIGAVNTIVRRPDGTLFGDNTDYAGFVYLLGRNGIDPDGRKVMILGSGGTSRTAAAAIHDMGAREILVVSRHPGTGGPGGIRQISYAEIGFHADTEILINTTPAGMYPHNGTAAADLTILPNLCALADVVYNPLRSALILHAEERGIRAAGGLAMLAAQAYFAEQVFEGYIPEESGSGKPVWEENARIEQVFRTLESGMKNVVLIGMPGSGKTSIGRAVAGKLGRPFIDLDLYIKEKIGRTPERIIREDGETVFRDIEAACCADAGKLRGQVIATGGGTPLRPDNRAALRQNGTVFYLLRPVSELPVEGRPLSEGADLSKMEQVRTPFYQKTADFTIRNTGTPEKTVDEILKLLDNN